MCRYCDERREWGTREAEQERQRKRQDAKGLGLLLGAVAGGALVFLMQAHSLGGIFASAVLIVAGALGGTDLLGAIFLFAFIIVTGASVVVAFVLGLCGSHHLVALLCAATLGAASGPFAAVYLMSERERMANKETRDDDSLYGWERAEDVEHELRKVTRGDRIEFREDTGGEKLTCNDCKRPATYQLMVRPVIPPTAEAWFCDAHVCQAAANCDQLQSEP